MQKNAFCVRKLKQANGITSEITGKCLRKKHGKEEKGLTESWLKPE